MAEEVQGAEDLSLGDVLSEIVRHAPIIWLIDMEYIE